MDQPKFKFGDKVKDKDHGEIFEVKEIIFHEGKRFMYLVKPDSVIMNCHFDGGFWESDLELYQEPQKKKLYAYKFYMQTEDATRLDFYLNEFSPKFGRRAPEYDLDYQSQNYSTNGMPDINSRARG